MGPPVARIALRADENNDIFLLLLLLLATSIVHFSFCSPNVIAAHHLFPAAAECNSLRVLFLSGPFYTYLKAINPQEEKERLLEHHRGLLRFNLLGNASSTQPVPVFVEQPEGDARRGGGGGRGVLPLGRREDLLDRHIAPPRLPLVLLVVVAVVTHPQR